VTEEDHKSLTSWISKLKELEWDKFNLHSLEDSFTWHELVIKELKELIPSTNSIFEVFLSEIIYLGKTLGINIDQYEEHFYEELPKWYDFEKKDFLAVRGAYEWKLGLWLFKRDNYS